jgi:hypothetical protein
MPNAAKEEERGKQPKEKYIYYLSLSEKAVKKHKATKIDKRTRLDIMNYEL